MISAKETGCLVFPQDKVSFTQWLLFIIKISNVFSAGVTYVTKRKKPPIVLFFQKQYNKSKETTVTKRQKKG